MIYRYTALDAQGQRCQGQLIANDTNEVASRLRDAGLELITASRARQWHLQRLSRRELMHFCFQLEQLTDAGIPLLEGLKDLAQDQTQGQLRLLLADIIHRIEHGDLLSRALNRHPEDFPPIFVSLVAAGEASGLLPEILQAIGDNLKYEDELVAQTRKALLYPGFVLLVVTLVTTFLLLVMVPQLKHFVTQMNTPLNLPSRLLFLASEYLLAAGAWSLLFPGTLAVIIVTATQHPGLRQSLQGLLNRLPVIGKLRRDINLSRFSATLALLYGAGIPVLDALQHTRQTLSDLQLSRAVSDAQKAIHGGLGISQSFTATGAFPPLVTRMLRIGEQTGALDRALQHIARLYQRDARDGIGRLQTMIEPTLTVLLGAILGWIMMAVLGPIYDVISQVRV